MRIFGVIPFIALCDYRKTLKQQLNGEKWAAELGHLPAFGWALLFSCPVLGIIDCLHAVSHKLWKTILLVFAVSHRAGYEGQ